MSKAFAALEATQPLCGYIDCEERATWLADICNHSWPKPRYRCGAHGGHHDFTHHWDGEKWVEVEVRT